MTGKINYEEFLNIMIG